MDTLMNTDLESIPDVHCLTEHIETQFLIEIKNKKQTQIFFPLHRKWSI